MKRFIFFALIGLAIITGCSKSDDNSSNSFSDKLTIGNGMNASNFTLIAEGTSFLSTDILYFRLESKDDMAGSAIQIKIENNNGGVYSLKNTIEIANPQSYGHILISNISTLAAGQYRLTGILKANSKSVASVNITVN